ncbi:unnamed protein product [Allacma fusca]|uniref:Major facilitator superfamily (MFS) profile domain-containing protein n=1 Tax=Allacma fusca TaxID=39272 RepID=A0A8J2LJ40_9HEXA|nr:unnamed protein product [Allacma fusca]
MDNVRSFERKRTISFWIAMSYRFISACELVMILPSIWLYLQSLGVSRTEWLGLTISAPSVSSALTGLAVLVCGTFCLQDLFLVGPNTACPRFASGAGIAFSAEFGRITTREERVAFLPIFDAANYVGTIFGPVLQWCLSHFHFTIFGLSVNPLNGPGLMTASLSGLHILLTLFLYSNLTDDFKEIQIHSHQNIPLSLDTDNKSSDSILTKPETGAMGNGVLHRSTGKGGVYNQYKKELLTKPFVFLLFMAFVIFTCQVSVETIIPIITQEYFGYHAVENTWILTVAAIEALLFFVGIVFLRKYVRETTLLLIGWFLIAIALIWLMVLLPKLEHGNGTHVVYFLGGVFTCMLGIPIAAAAHIVLLSKVMSSETQGLGQGIGRLVTFSGLVVGPNWAGWTYESPYIFLGFLLILLLANGLLLIKIYTRLRKFEEDQPHDPLDSEEMREDEFTHLITSNKTS